MFCSDMEKGKVLGLIIVLVSKLKQKLLFGLRLLLFMAILVILTGQLWGLLQSTQIYSKWFNEDHPNGNPMRVETGMPKGPAFIDSIVEVFRNYCHKTNK